MTDNVVVLGAGYAGAGAIKSLEEELNGEADVTWISDTDYHLVLHESHRCVRDPAIREKVTIPVDDIKTPGTDFVQGEAVDVDTEERVVELDDGSTVDYDYLLITIGSRTAFFGIEGLREYAHTLKSLDDALDIHDAVADATREATRDDPARIVVGGAGLSGIQTAGEIAEYRDERDAPLDIYLVEGLDEVMPNGDPKLQDAIRERLEEKGIQIMCGEFIGEVDEDTVYIGEDDELAYDELIWTGGITGREAVRDVDVEGDERSYRIHSEQDFQTSDDRVFAIGDCALVDQPGENPAPPTAQAAWQAAEVAGENLARAVRGQPLTTWTFDDMGTVVSVGDTAVAHGVKYMGISAPVDTFGGFLAESLKKAIAAKWIRKVSSTGRAAKAWPDM